METRRQRDFYGAIAYIAGMSETLIAVLTVRSRADRTQRSDTIADVFNRSELATLVFKARRFKKGNQGSCKLGFMLVTKPPLRHVHSIGWRLRCTW
jgi:hypothetical protein